jgi:ubiquitin carboxyl-terminal hydrolase 14
MASIPGRHPPRKPPPAPQLIPVFTVIVKHQGKKHEVEVDTSSNGETFKYQLFSITGVEPERQKILVKGGQLKDDADMSKLGLKSGQTIMMMGTPSGDNTNILEKPKEKMKFLEDMDEAEAAQLEGATPAGLQNLGNTCYMNSTLQVLRSVPELQEELLRYSDRYVGSELEDTCIH